MRGFRAVGLITVLTVGCGGDGGGGGGGGGATEFDYMPESVLGRGPGTLGLNVEVNQPALLKATLARHDENGLEVEAVYAACDRVLERREQDECWSKAA